MDLYLFLKNLMENLKNKQLNPFRLTTFEYIWIHSSVFKME